jgi:hypothetical protein
LEQRQLNVVSQLIIQVHITFPILGLHRIESIIVC